MLMVLLVLMVLLGGCQQQQYRYTTHAPDSHIRQRIRVAAVAGGWRLNQRGENTDVYEVEPSSDPAPESPSVVDTDDDTAPPFVVRVFPLDNGQKVLELKGASDPSFMESLQLKERSRSYTQSYTGFGPNFLDLNTDIGMAKVPGRPSFTRIDLSVRYGRILSPSSVAFPRKYQWSFATLVGLGSTNELFREGQRHSSIRPELRLSARLQESVAVAPGRTIRIAPRYNIDVSIGQVIGVSHRKQATEVGLDLYVSPLLGVFGRAGYQWSPEPGFTSVVGVKVGSYSTAYALGAALLGLFLATR